MEVDQKIRKASRAQGLNHPGARYRSVRRCDHPYIDSAAVSNRCHKQRHEV
jgi:hypothetical protein